MMRAPKPRFVYAHMCQMQHIEIGHNDSGKDERCPLCRAMDEVHDLKIQRGRLETELKKLRGGQG